MGRTASIGNATFCGDRACRGRGMPGKLMFMHIPAQPFTEIARIGGAECKENGGFAHSSATLCRDRARRRRGNLWEFLMTPGSEIMRAPN